jgi:hypothetical protein
MQSMHKIKYSFTYEVTFCIGSREGYNGRAFTREEVLDQINLFQKGFTGSMPVKVSDTVTFTMKDYRENGWEVSAITYPNSSASIDEVKNFMRNLAEHLLYHFKQNRITIRETFNGPTLVGSEPNTIMLEMNDAEKTHHK